MQTRQIQIPIEAQGLINELKAQNAMLGDRCGMMAAENAGLAAENAALKTQLGSKQQAAEERKAAKKAKGDAPADGAGAKTDLV